MTRGLEFITEIKIAQFWRSQLGEHEYLRFDAEDLRRWYEAFELRGAGEIRAYLQERNSRFPTSTVTGIVGKAPHPPLKVVELWLATHDKVRTRGWWVAFAAFFLFVYFTATNLQGCTNLRDMSRMEMRPPRIGGQLPQSTGPLPQSAATMPQNLPAPAQTAGHPSEGGNRPPH